MIEVELPNGTIAEFPDEMPREAIAAVLQKQFGAPSAAPDTKDTPFVERREGAAGAFNKYVRTPAQRAAGGLAGLPGDISRGADYAAAWLANQALKATGLPENPPDARIKPPMDIPGSTEIRRGIEGLGLPEIPAESSGGKIAQEAVTGAMSGGPFGRAATVLGAASAAAGEGAGQLAEGTSLEAPARFAGAVLPMLAYGGYNATRMRTPDIVRQGVGSLTDDQMAAAQRLMQDAAQAGTPLTSAEAIAQVTGNRLNPMLNAQRSVENSGRTSGPVNELKGMIAARGPANAKAFDRTVQAPQRELTEIAPDVQRAAQRPIDEARRETNRISGPAYDATTNNPQAVLSAPATARVLEDPSVTMAIREARADPRRYGNLEGLPDNSVRVLDAAKRSLDTLEATARTGGERTTLANIGQTRERLLDAIDQEFPRYASARMIQTVRQRYVEEPLGRTATAQVAQAEKLEKQFNVLFTKNPADVPPGQVRDAIANVSRADPELAVDFVNRYLQRQFRLAEKATGRTDPSRAGANYSARVFGDPDVGRNVEAAIRALPDGNVRWDAFRRMNDIFEAQGTRLPVGSPTESNRLLTEQLKGGGVAGVAKAGANPFGTAKQTLEWWRYGRNQNGLARALTGDVENLRQILTVGPRNERAAVLATSLLEGQRLSDKTGQPKQ